MKLSEVTGKLGLDIERFAIEIVGRKNPRERIKDGVNHARRMWETKKNNKVIRLEKLDSCRRGKGEKRYIT